MVEELIKWVEEGWGIINGVKERNEEEMTFTGGEIVIDYVIGDKGA